MKVHFIVPIIASLVIGCPSAFAQSGTNTGPRPAPTTEQMDQRFQQMSTMMEQAQKAHGIQLTELMRKHMQLMQEQMQAMHSMMGTDGMMGGNGMMGGTGMMGRAGSSNGAGNANTPAQMQARMDLMQRMMEQMLDQQKMMMPAPAPAK